MTADEDPAPRRELREGLGQLGLGSAVGDDDLGAVGGGETRRRHPGPSQSDHQHPGEVQAAHPHLNFRVDSPARAKTTAMIQKRVTTWVSVQPSSSK